MAGKKGLGRSFESLIPDDLLDESFDPTAGDDHAVSELRQIKLDDITADPEQPRKHFDTEALDGLTESIKVHGVLQPIVVVTKKQGGYEIVAGERRWRAAKKAGLAKIPALVRTLSNQKKLELAIIENVQRHDLNPMETATAYAKLREQFNLSLEEIGQRMGGKSVSAISNTLRLLKLAPSAKKALQEGLITEGQARPLIELSDSEVAELLPKITKEHWSARVVEQAAHDEKAKKRSNGVVSNERMLSEHHMFQQALAARLGRDVRIDVSKHGKGKIVIEFENPEDLAQLKNQLLPLEASNLVEWENP